MTDKQRFAIIVTGDRNWDDGRLINERLATYPDGTLLLHGEAKGADTLAGRLSKANRLVEMKIPYISWLGRSGGPARNATMLRVLLALEATGFTVAVEAFHDDLSASAGTYDMMTTAKAKGVKVKWNHHEGAKNRKGKVV